MTGKLQSSKFAIGIFITFVTLLIYMVGGGLVFQAASILFSPRAATFIMPFHVFPDCPGGEFHLEQCGCPWVMGFLYHRHIQLYNSAWILLFICLSPHGYKYFFDRRAIWY